MKRLALALALSAFAVSASAAVDPVASIASQEGVVLVNQGEEFVTALDSQLLQPGDRVLVMEGGSAVVAFNDGCSLPLESGSMVVVPAQSTCAGAVAQVQRIGPTYAAAVGSETEPRDATEFALLGGAAIVMALILSDDEDNPNSP